MKKVSEFMRKKVLTVSLNTPIEDIWSLIFKKGIHALPVVDGKSKLLGIISEEDLLSKVYPEYSEIMNEINNFDLNSVEGEVKKLKRFTAKEVMSTTVFSTAPDVSIFLALSRMLMLQVRQLPVVNSRGIVIGMISKGDLFDYIFKHYFILSRS
jgi:CBS domain-containing protein